MKTISDLKAGMKIQCLSLIFITCTLIILFSIVGCSDTSTPYTGTMLTPVDVSDYTISNSGGIYCIYNDTDSSCIDLIPLVKNGTEGKGPIVHIYPEKTLYLFYYEGNPIVRAERVGDTSDIVKTLIDKDGDPPNGNPTSPDDPGNNPNDNDDDNSDDEDDDNSDDPDHPDDPDEEDTPDNTDPTNNGRDGHGWLIWIYYPEGTAPLNTPTLSESEVTVTINGRQLSDKDITGFAQFIDANGERGIQFFYPTVSAELLDLNIKMIGITDIDGTVKFNINYLWKSY